MNILRCENSQDKLPPTKLPPTDDSFLLHLKRIQDQQAIWRQTTVPVQVTGNAVLFGYELDAHSGKLIPQMMNQPPAAPELLNDLVCDCDAEQ